jgi:WD40-like Beta Propeller Repeat
MKKIFFSLVMIAGLGLSACASPAGVSTTQPSSSDQVATIVAATMQALPTNTPVPTTQPTAESIVVAFVKNGDIHVWESTTQESELVFNADDAGMVTISGDGQLIVFFRRWVDSNQCEQRALWVVERNGENAREIISPAELRDFLDATECDLATASIDKIEWLPQTHRLVYSLISDHEHSSPQGIYLSDADTLATTMLVSTDHSLGFVPSPDGSQIALMATTGLSFINVDGSNWRQNVLTYPKKGVPIPYIPNGAWTQDGHAFLIATPIESESMFALNHTIVRVPVDGSDSQSLATLTNTNPRSISFSPDGKHVAFIDNSYQGKDQSDRRWAIMPLAGDGEPLAIPYRTDLGAYANLHWSPVGVPYAVNEQKLFQLCLDAAQSSDICDRVNPEYVGFSAIQWMDGKRFLFLTGSPSVLFLGSVDHTTMPVVAWSLEDGVSFSAVLLAPGK